MPGKDAPEFSYDPKTKLYRKKVKNEEGRWIPVYGKSKSEIRTNVKNREAEIARIIAEQNTPLCYQYFAEWFKLWVPGKGKTHADSVRNAINNHILPAIGNTRMVDVTEADLIGILNGVTEKSQSLNNKIVRTLKLVFKSAKKAGVIRDNPAADIKAGGQDTKEKVPLNEKQQNTLLEALKGTRAYTFVLIILHTGLRREEALALVWDNVHLDVDHPYISVRRALRWEKNKPIVSDELKSPAAKRDIPIAPQLVEHLKSEKSKSKGDYIMGGNAPWTESAFSKCWDAIEARSTWTETVVDDEGNETIIEHKLGEKVRNHPIYLTIDFHVTPHTLRHTYITRLILAGVNIKVVQYLAGHSSVEITLNIYTHLMENRPQDTAAAVLAAFGIGENLDPVLDPKESKDPNLDPIVINILPVSAQTFTN